MALFAACAGLDADGADDDAAPYPSEAGIMFTAKEVLKQLGRYVFLLLLIRCGTQRVDLR